MRPGRQLKVVELATSFGVSQSVIREALTRLSESSLVVATPQRGFRVRPLSVQDIAELTETRVQLETAALRLAIERGDLDWETDVVSAHYALERTPVVSAGVVSEEWSARHREFHRVVLAGCANTRMTHLATMLRDSSELYRRWYWVLTDDHDRDIAEEHRLLRDLAIGRDADAAAQLLREHIERAPALLIEYAREHGEQSFDLGPVD